MELLKCGNADYLFNLVEDSLVKVGRKSPIMLKIHTIATKDLKKRSSIEMDKESYKMDA